MTIKQHLLRIKQLLIIFMKIKLIIIIIFSWCTQQSFSQPVFPGNAIGEAKITLSKKAWLLKNGVLKATWKINKQVVQSPELINKETGQMISWKDKEWFSIVLKNGDRLTSNDFILTALPFVEKIKAHPAADKLSDRYNGEKIVAIFNNTKSGITIHWEVILKNDANYLRQLFTFSSSDSVIIESVRLLETSGENGMRPYGIVSGSPLVTKNIFLSIEHPLSLIDTTGNKLSSYVKNYYPITRSSHLSFSVVWGITPEQQMRRGFLYYLERERAVPYRQQLHYNSWYDLSWSNLKLNETSCLNRIQMFADSLITKRKIPLNAFLFDDGWDNNKSLWQFTDSFPNGFSKLSQLAHKYHSGLGVWISPWGGYDPEKKERIEYGKKQDPPFETNASGFSLSGPIYNKRFYSVASNFIQKYGVTMFKFDGLGAGNDNTETGDYQKDVDAMLKLLVDLRSIKPDLFFSLTVGTWASPYWLFYGDAIWRNGKDTDMTGTGSNRQQWITYRDAETYKNVVKKGPLFPLNSLMLHGICIADNGNPSKYEMSYKGISDEIWSFFASGTCMQELYINPHKLSSQLWDCLSDAITWSQKNARILADVHWIGGDPLKGEIYGWAAWSPEKSIFSLRNPSGETKTFHVNTFQMLELPMKANKDYLFYNVGNESKNEGKAFEGQEFELVLHPFEVKVFEGFAKK